MVANKRTSGVADVSIIATIITVHIAKSMTRSVPPQADMLGITIAEADGFLQANGMINLVTERKSTGTLSFGFEINLAAAQKANLKLNAELLKWAKQVKT